MVRSLSFLAAVATCLLGLVSAEAAKKPAVPTDSNAVVGTISGYDEDSKTLTITTVAATKKAPAKTVDVKIGGTTKTTYLGIDDKNAQKLDKGYKVQVTLDPDNKDTAATVKVSKAPEKKKKKTT